MGEKGLGRTVLHSGFHDAVGLGAVIQIPQLLQFC